MPALREGLLFGENVAVPEAGRLTYVMDFDNRMGPGMAGASRDLDRFAGAAAGGAGRLTAAFGQMAGAAGLFQVVVASLKSGVEAERSLANLAHSVELAGGTIEAYGPRIRETVSRLFDASAYDDEEIQDALAQLVTMTGSVEAGLSALPVVIDAAAKSGQGLREMAQGIGVAAEGSTRSLRQFGISLTEAETKQFQAASEGERLAWVLDQLAAKTGGAAAAQLDTWAGKWKVASRNLQEFGEQIGTSTLKELDALQEKLQQIGDVFGYIVTGKLPAWADPVQLRALREAATLEGVGGPYWERGEVRGEPVGLPDAPDKKKKTAEWKSDVDQLNAAILELMKNFKIVEANRGSWDGAITAYTEPLVRLGDEAVRTGQKTSREFARMVEAARELQLSLLPELPVSGIDPFGSLSQTTTAQRIAREFEERRKANYEDEKRLIADLLDLRLDADEVRRQREEQWWREVARDSVDQFEREWQGIRGTISDVFAAGLTGGTEGLLSVLQNILAQGAQGFGDFIAQQLTQLFGGPPRREDFTAGPLGEAQYQRAVQQAGGGAGAWGQVFGQGLSGAMGLAGAVTNPNRQDDFGTVLSGTLGGAALGGAVGTGVGLLSGVAAGAIAGSAFPVIGTIIGAAVGLIAGALSAALTSVSDDYRYGRPSISGGQFRITGTQNIPARELDELIQRGQEALESAYNGYAKILISVREFIPEFTGTFLDEMDHEFRRGLDSGGFIGREASAHFMQHLNRLFEEGVPEEVAKMFEPYFEQVFDRLGYSAARFSELWGYLGDIDPSKAMELLQILVTAGRGLREGYQFLTTPTGFGGVNVADPNATHRGYLSGRLNQTFGQGLEELEGRIRDTADSLDLLVGEDQIRAAGDLNNLLEERNRIVSQFLESVIRGIVETNLGAGAAQREIGMRRRAGDPQGQIDFLTEYYEQLQRELATATTPDEVRRIRDELFNVIMQIMGIGETMGPEAAAAFYDWAEEAVEATRVHVVARLEAMGAEIDDANADLAAAIRAPIDRFFEVGTAAAGVRRDLDDLGAGAREATRAINAMTEAADEFVGAAGAMGSTAFVAKTRAGRA